MSRARHKEHHGKHHKADGGRIGLKAAGNPDVFKEAEGKEDYAKGDERKRGGKVKMKKEMHAEGHKAHHRMDRPKRARGGKVFGGSDQAPFSSARKAIKGHRGEETTPDGEPD